jgi:hypothetical protein
MPAVTIAAVLAAPSKELVVPGSGGVSVFHCQVGGQRVASPRRTSRPRRHNQRMGGVAVCGVAGVGHGMAAAKALIRVVTRASKRARSRLSPME